MMNPGGLLSEQMNNALNQRDTFEALYQECFTPLYKYVWIRVRDYDLAMDIIQTTFAKAYGQHEPIRSEKQLNYLYTIARNTLIDHYRKKYSISYDGMESFLEKLPDNQPTPEEVAGEKNILDQVMKLFTSLSQIEQDVITMKYFQELENDEIAAITGKTNDAVRQIQSRAIAKLRKLYEN